MFSSPPKPAAFNNYENSFSVRYQLEDYKLIVFVKR